MLFSGAASYYEQNKQHSFDELKRKVATPKGTTEAGLNEMAALEELFSTVIGASIARSRQLNLEISANASKSA